jgi:hypothetical protein
MNKAKLKLGMSSLKKSIHFNEKNHVSAYIVKISVVTSQWLAKGVVHIFNHLLFKLFSCIL